MPLCTSVPDERRVTTTLSGDPVSTSVFLRPSCSISTVANTNTTSAMPAAVSAVVSLRAMRFFAVYKNGITIFESSPQRRRGAEETQRNPDMKYHSGRTFPIGKLMPHPDLHIPV